MDWTNRGGQQTQAAAPTAPVAHTGGRSRKKPFGALQWSSVALLFSVAALVLALIVFLGLGNTKGGTNGGYVNKDRMQAVFLNGGQVYFGKIKDINSQSLRMTDIYYLRVNQTVQPNQQAPQNNSNDISLVKLGCELHGPEDAMVINQEQVIFWENLKTDGQVADAVKKYKEANPGAQNCSTASTGGTGSGTTPATNSGSGTNLNSTTPNSTTPSTNR